jgi:putative pneumococcal surface protein|nr:MAG TPA: Excalibur calcium-binding domain protein [Caudoviricetes sp.]
MRNKKVLLAILLGGVILALPMAGATKKVKKTTGNSTVYFKSCKEARAAGYSDIKKGEPGYSSKLDRDGDGIACESK